jgi:hypothetical protein
MRIARSCLLLASVLAAPVLVGPLRAAEDREHEPGGERGRGHERDHWSERHREREAHGCGCGVVDVSSTADRRHWARERFSARRTESVAIRLRMRTAGGDAHLVRFQVLTPKGHLYQELRATERPDGRRSKYVSADLPVAGTFIATSSLFGRWRVVPYLDDDAEPCAAGAVFTIVE